MTMRTTTLVSMLGLAWLMMPSPGFGQTREAPESAALARAKSDSARARTEAKVQALAADLKNLRRGKGVAPSYHGEDFAAALRGGEKDAQLAAAVTNIILDPLKPSDQRLHPGAALTRKVAFAMTASRSPVYRSAMKTLYENAFKINDLDDLAEAQENCRIFHAAMLQEGVSTQPDFFRSTAYKRILRKQVYLREHGP